MFRTDLIGNLGADAEVRYTAAGAKIVSLRVAVNLRQRTEGGEWENVTEWIGVRVMGRQADYAEKLAKGGRIYATGTLDVRRYTGRDGKPGFALDVWAEEVVSLTQRESDPKEQTTSRPGPTSIAARNSEPDAGALDDLPF